MPIKQYKPTTPGRRKASIVDHASLSKKRPEKKLITAIKKKAGRNNRGVVTVRHRGGGHKKYYRLIDNKRFRLDAPATVRALEYDPNRTSWIALIQYQNGEKGYIIAPHNLKKEDIIISSKNKVDIKPGNRTVLYNIPVGTPIHNIEINPGSAGTMVRSAGSSALIQVVEGENAQVKLPSSEVRLFNKNCMATIGQVSNVDHENQRLGKAGKTRWLGKRPTVRGKSMNPVDHPHGGGEGSNPIGLKHPKTPWGKPALGVKTRKKYKYSDKFIIKRRNAK